MKIINVSSLLPRYEKVVLFTETSKDDYLFNSQLSLVSDMEDTENEKLARQYINIPEEAFASDRQCFFKCVSVKIGNMKR